MFAGSRFPRWLVREQQGRIDEQGTANRHTLPLALRQLIRVAIEHVTDTNALEQISGTLPNLVIQSQRAVYAVWQQDVIENIQVLQELEFLEHEPDVLDAKVTNGAIFEIGKFMARGDDIARLRSRDAGDQVKECGLSGTTRTHNGDALPTLHAQTRDAKTKIALVVAETHVGDFDHAVFLKIIVRANGLFIFILTIPEGLN